VWQLACVRTQKILWALSFSPLPNALLRKKFFLVFHIGFIYVFQTLNPKPIHQILVFGIKALCGQICKSFE
jgi:hypothetical protein